jgi:hypothetical protein
MNFTGNQNNTNGSNNKPVDRIGYSIDIYHITTEEANRIRREMGLPEIKEITSEQNQINEKSL